MINNDVYIIAIAGTALFLLLIIFMIDFIFIFRKRQQKSLHEKVLLRDQFEKEILTTQIEIQEQTLKNIGEEIHDNIGQALSLVKLNLNTLPVVNDPELIKKLGDSKSLISKTIADLRDISRNLYGEKIAELGLPEAIDTQLKIIQNTGQFKTSLNISGDICAIDQKKCIVLYRIVQESLSNILKYSSACEINVHLDYGRDIFKLIIKDDGVGFDITKLEVKKTGIGLKSMKNRAALIGFLFEIVSSTNSGTTVIVSIARRDL